MCNLNVIVVLEFISRGLYLLFAILLSSKFQNSIFYQHMRPKSGLEFPRHLEGHIYYFYVLDVYNVVTVKHQLVYISFVILQRYVYSRGQFDLHN